MIQALKPVYSSPITVTKCEHTIYAPFTYLLLSIRLIQKLSEHCEQTSSLRCPELVSNEVSKDQKPKRHTRKERTGCA